MMLKQEFQNPSHLIKTKIWYSSVPLLLFNCLHLPISPMPALQNCMFFLEVLASSQWTDSVDIWHSFPFDLENILGYVPPQYHRPLGYLVFVCPQSHP
jgi:hypothetical protein